MSEDCDNKDEAGHACFGCLLMRTIEEQYGEDNPLDLEEAIPVLTGLLADMIASFEHQQDRKAATADVVRWLKSGIKQARTPVRMRMVSGVVH